MDAKKLLKKRQTKQTMITEQGAERNSFEQHIESAVVTSGDPLTPKKYAFSIFFQSFRKLRVEVHLKVLKLILGDSTPNEMCRSVSVCLGVCRFVSVRVGSSRLALSSPKIDSFKLEFT